jgi:hypothetical protein
MATTMQEPFTELTRLRLSSTDGDMPVLPGTFLGGSAPCLQDVLLDGIPFPSLPTLLSSASNLVTLKLDKIPQTGYISPGGNGCQSNRIDQAHDPFHSIPIADLSP